MPVIVEASLSYSLWQKFFDLLPLVLCSMLLLLTGFFWFVPIAVSVGLWSWYSHCQSEPAFQYIRVNGDLVTLWHDDQHRQTFKWLGQGWRNALFIRWTLFDDDGLQLTYYLWKDAVSDASWRALNMVYRVYSGDR